MHLDMHYPIAFDEWLNATDVNCVPLAEISWCGSHRQANMSLNASILL